MQPLTVLERTPSLAGALPATLSALSSASTLRRYARREQLWQAGENPRHFVVIRSGLVKVVRSSPSGRSIICGLFGAPGSVGDLPLLSGQPYPASAIACADRVEVLLVPREVLFRELGKDPALLASFCASTQEEMLQLLAKIDVLSAGSVEARIATLLIVLGEKFGDELEDGSCMLPIRLARHELAELVSTSTETAIRVVSRWEKEGVLHSHPRGFVLFEPGRLRDLGGAH